MGRFSCLFTPRNNVQVKKRKNFFWDSVTLNTDLQKKKSQEDALKSCHLFSIKGLKQPPPRNFLFKVYHFFIYFTPNSPNSNNTGHIFKSLHLCVASIWASQIEARRSHQENIIMTLQR